MKISIIDIGTKSLKHYIFQVTNDDKELLHYKRYSEANLGAEEGINTETETRIFSILDECLTLNKSLDTKNLQIVGTEIFRASESARQFAMKIKNLAGCEVKILDHATEAYYLYAGFIDLLETGDNFAAANIGGGSTELVLGNKTGLIDYQTLTFGVNALKKNFGPDDIDWASLEAYLDKNIKPGRIAVERIFVTGVLDFLNVVGPQLGFKFDAGTVKNHPISLSLREYRQLVKKIQITPIAELRKIYQQDPDFANNVAIGQTVYLKAAEKLGASIIIPSRNDLTDGIIQGIE